MEVGRTGKDLGVVMNDAVILDIADIVLVRGDSIISKAIRWFTQAFGEPRTKVNHCGIVVEYGTLDKAVIVEALHKVKMQPLVSRYGPMSSTSVAVFRPKNLNLVQYDLIRIEALKYVDHRYGYAKLLAHLADYCLFGTYCFRKLADNPNYPICSWVVAAAYAKVGKYFGVDPGMATPDDIWDFCVNNPDIYRQVRPLAPIKIEVEKIGDQEG
jgi:hypothetical protein